MSKISPNHYQQGSIEVWDFIVDQQLGYLEGNIVKYISRAGKKDNESRLDDLLKAQAYIHKAVSTELTNVILPNTRPNGSSDYFPNGNVPADCYDEYNSPYDAAMFDR
tara:strand:+ start:252 stop:575 length:324 start_codon:yes stop_codon:yes gene_type:complete